LILEGKRVIFTKNTTVMHELTLSSIVWQESDYFVAQCIPVDVSSFGETREEALQNLDEALALYFEDISANEIPIVRNPELVNVQVRCA
jgi:predicted RNase H-like HicB family nuclease